MKKRFRDRWLINLALLIAIGGLLAISFFEEKPENPAKRTLGDFLPERITEIRIQHPGKKELYFRLSNDHWNMISPYQIRADATLIKQLLSLTSTEISASIDSKINKTEFGLDQPVTRVQFNQHQLNFGDSQPVNQQRYVELDSRVMLIPDKHMSQLNASSISYVDRHLIPEGSKIDTLDINGQAVTPERFTPWLSTKAHWISFAGTEKTPAGSEITIQLANNKPLINYVANKSQADFILTNIQSKLEYHLPLTAIQMLGLSAIEQADTETAEKKIDKPQN